MPSSVRIRTGRKVYFVYNRVASINHIGELLGISITWFTYAIAHGGQMTGQIEEIMTDFYEGPLWMYYCLPVSLKPA